jgi:hypothetical protein
VVWRRSAVGDKTLRVLGATTPDDAIGIAEKALGIT